MQYLAPEQLQFPDEEQKFSKSLHKMADYFQMEQIIPELENACYYIERNANGKILFHALSIKLHRIFAKQAVK
jgi:DNA polymerase-3 subunit delta'